MQSTDLKVMKKHRQAVYPQIVKANLPEIINILSQIKVDDNFDDTNALLRLKEIITEMMHTTK
ncbi:hypothetical protein SAMN00017405_1613 [Desulfonispora thiosulfatigenes DSM 11270]|uniref:Uncharacterized protein n=2 Tax=Desulfonispora thiosulfatigenes TaxID=83661 RepID=A0A1W1UVP7_DESTI|nr:hypothetical protein SAMN00017405_1613 [Desulfonispora thiosulfatigenes DSM 11270]